MKRFIEVVGMSDVTAKAVSKPETAEEQVICCEMRISPNGTYEVYKAPSAALAKAFLSKKNLSGSDAHIIVETPEGNWCVDSEGIYLEKLLPFQLSLEQAQCRGQIKFPPSPLGLKLAAMGFSDNFTAHVKCGKCGHIWLDGLRYKNRTLVKCPQCQALNEVDSRRYSYTSRIPKACNSPVSSKRAARMQRD